MTDRELMQKVFDAMSYGNTDERQAARLALRDRLAQPDTDKNQLEWQKLQTEQWKMIVRDMITKLQEKNDV